MGFTAAKRAQVVNGCWLDAARLSHELQTACSWSWWADPQTLMWRSCRWWLVSSPRGKARVNAAAGLILRWFGWAANSVEALPIVIHLRRQGRPTRYRCCSRCLSGFSLLYMRGNGQAGWMPCALDTIGDVTGLPTLLSYFDSILFFRFRTARQSSQACSSALHLVRSHDLLSSLFLAVLVLYSFVLHSSFSSLMLSLLVSIPG